MSQVSYLIRIGASYYARLRVPLDLREIVGAEFRKKSLRTKDRDEAKRRMWPVIEEWNREFDDLRSRQNVSAEDRERAGWDHYSGALERDEIARQHMPTPDEIEKAREDTIATIQREGFDLGDGLAVLSASTDFLVTKGGREWDAHARRVKLDTLRRHLTEGEFALIADEVDEFIRKNRLLTKPGSSDYTDLARRFMRAEIQYLERSLERDAGDYSGTSKDPVVTPPTGTAHETAKPGETIMELFEKYARQNPNGVAPDTLNQARRDIRSFIEVHGTGFPAHRIDKPAVAAWMDLLELYPVKATETKAFAGMKLPEIVKENERIGKPTLTPRTINRYLSSLGAFCDWLTKRGVLQINPTQGMSLAKEKKITTTPFKPDQLVTLFSSPLFTGCLSSDEWRNVAKPGNVAIRDHRFWVPIIMLYSGARPGEIAQLSVADVRTQDGIPFMHITILGDDEKSVKTRGSMRVVPIHSELVRLGFLDHHVRMKEAGEAKLFPEAKRNARGQMIADFSREFGRYLERIGLKKGRGLSLYSFRHGVADAFRMVGHMNEDFGYILGHTKASTTNIYGVLSQGTLTQRVELIEKIAYPGLDLSHLMP
ncbi:site-specific integrase [Aureimonas sp. AU20]|uniref:site-specific integrase n=1 Tax=Aureimonas sp. AU20 TaxID=1349819 RepID=UPI00072085C1|nr:site-specific integrase [Aureimonas sp. AU20]ALN73592.1 hypothetical protein M673_12760 [Aureimonas sp. AU20]